MGKIYSMKRITILIVCLLWNVIHLLAQDKLEKQRHIQVYINDFKLFNTEKITLVGDTLRTDYCLNSECTQFISWQFGLKDIDKMKVGKDKDQGTYFLQFKCASGECIQPPTIGTIYSHKEEYSLYMKGKKEAEQLLDLLKEYQE